jgi:hypothetical protein
LNAFSFYSPAAGPKKQNLVRYRYPSQQRQPKRNLTLWVQGLR